MKKIRNSDRLVESIVGPGMDLWFSIQSRMSSSGAPTFSLLYRSFRGGSIPLLVDVPLREVKAGLKRFAETNSMTEFCYVTELIKELGGSVGEKQSRFYPPLLNAGEWKWCEKCRGLKRGRVVQSEGQYFIRPTIRPTKEGNRLYGHVAELCSCGKHEVEIVLASVIN